MFHLFNDTDQPVKEFQVTLSDEGAVSRYVRNMPSGQNPTVQGIELARQTIGIGPLPTILPHTASEVTTFRKNIAGYANWHFSAHMQTDSHLFDETIQLRRLPDGGAAVSEILTTHSEKGPVMVWQRISDNFPKDFAVE